MEGDEASAGGDERAVPIAGGLNNQLFDVDDAEHGRLCRKVYKQDGHNRDGREWTALTTLERLGVDFAPRPLRRARGVIEMSWVEGQPLGGRTLDQSQIEELFRVLTVLYSLPASPTLDPITGNPRALHARMTATLEDKAGSNLAIDTVSDWLRGPEMQRLVDAPLDTLGRGDPNLANCLWNDGKIALIDWEYFGRTSRPYELADHVEHLQARNTDWSEFILRFEFTPEEQDLYEVSRRLLAGYWLLLLQPGERGYDLNPPGTLEEQERRVLELFS